MKNKLFKQVSLLVFCISFSSLPTLAAEWGSVFENANQAVEATKFFKDNQRVKPIEYASREFYEGLFTISKQNKD